MYKEILKNEEIRTFIHKGNENLAVMGYTDHSEAHTTLVAERAAYILERFGYSEREIENAKIAGYMHDIGNVINRKNHAEYGAILANDILQKLDVPVTDRVIIVSAIGHHDESTGGAKDAVSAALIIADKADVRRNRVMEQERSAFDIHDRVNYAVTDCVLQADATEKTIVLKLQVDEKICSMYEYFDIFLGRMLMCRSAAEFLGATFVLTVNGTKIL